jgi:hypothetical protein
LPRAGEVRAVRCVSLV